jgi:YVTN family beta-propeller protein
MDIRGYLLAHLQYMSNKMNSDNRMRVERKEMEMAYVTGQSQVVVINQRTKEVTITIPDNMRDLSQVMAIFHDAGRSYVISGMALLVTDMKTEKVIDTISFEVGKQRLSGILMVPGGAHHQLYVAIGDSNSVSVVDTTTNEVKATIPVGQYPGSMAATSDGAWIYVRNYISRTLSVIDTRTNRVVDTIPVRESDSFRVANGVHGLDAVEYSCSNPSRKIMSITSEETAEGMEELSLLDGKKVAKRQMGMRKIAGVVVISVIVGSVVAFILLLDLDLCQLMGLRCSSLSSPSSPLKCEVAYVANQVGNTISVIDTSSDKVRGEPISLRFSPYAVAITPDGARAYVTNYDNNAVFVIDTVTNGVLSEIVVREPTGVAISPDGKKAYITGRNDEGVAAISVIDMSIDKVTRRILLNTKDSPTRIVLAPDGTQAYVVYSSGNQNQQLGRVSVVDIIKESMLTIPVGYTPYGIAITPNGTQVYVINQGISQVGGIYLNTTISVINTVTNQVKTIPIKEGIIPTGVAVSPDGNRVYVKSNGRSNTITVVDAVHNLMLSNISVHIPSSVDTSLGRVAISKDGKVYATAGRGAETVYVINASVPILNMQSIPVGRNPSAITIALIPC